ncbi:MAG: PIN domain-containing protein [Methylacidiphilales bacterium]|nr:PIN domain-containing protein [Candidatus Methylacidiphilales bacterium]
MKTRLLDAGPIIAYLDFRDPAHEFSVETLDGFNGQLITTSAVITEAMHFLIRHLNGPALLLEFLEVSSVKVVECCQPEDLRSAVALMTKYADTPMDFADATLVLLGDTLGQREICTLDRRGFSTYRTASGKRFNLVIG